MASRWEGSGLDGETRETALKPRPRPPVGAESLPAHILIGQRRLDGVRSHATGEGLDESLISPKTDSVESFLGTR